MDGDGARWPMYIGDPSSVSDEDREYWNERGHKDGCDQWGDDMGIFPCTCGPRARSKR